jgi:hypothetical protein
MSVERQELERERRMETVRRNNGIRGWGTVIRDLRGQESPSDERRSGDGASVRSDSRWWFGGGSQDGQGWSTPAVDVNLTWSARGAGRTARSASTLLTGPRTGSSQGLGMDGRRHRVHISSSFVKSIALRFFSSSSSSSGNDRPRRCLLDRH